MVMRKHLEAALKAGFKRPLSRKLDLRNARQFYEELNIELPRLLRQSDFRGFHRKLSEQSRRAFRSWRKASQQTLAHRLHFNTLEGLLSNGWREDIQQARDSAAAQLKLAESVEAELHRVRIRQSKAESVSLEVYRLFASERTPSDHERLETAIRDARQQIGFIDQYYPAVFDARDEWLYSDLRTSEDTADGPDGKSKAADS